MGDCFFDNDANCEVIPLITYVNDTYSVDPDTLRWISEHTTAFGVIACAGKYRTGKSFLLNRIARADTGVGFGVGDSVRACTKGLWIYKRFFSTDDPNKHVLIMDTEGIDALDANDTHDVRIFTLALLLCSTFLYNSVGAIDETAMQTLSLMTRVTDNVRLTSANKATTAELSQFMPRFYWILRDFSLKLIGKTGDAITPTEYLEEALESTDKVKENVRGAIRNAFPQRQLFTLPVPSHTNGNSQSLEDRLFSLSKQFTGEVDTLRNDLFSNVAPMRAQNSPMTGTMYVSFCKHLVEIVQSNAIPVMHDSWTLLAKVQSQEVQERLLKEFDEYIEDTPNGVFHTMETDLRQTYKRSLQEYDRSVMHPDTEQRSAFDRTLLTRIERTLSEFSNRLSTQMAAILDAMTEQIRENPSNMMTIIRTNQRQFLAKYGDTPQLLNLWTSEVGKRILTHWIDLFEHDQRSVQMKLDHEIDANRIAQEQMQRNIDTMRQELVMETQLERTELVATVRSQLQLIEQEQSENTYLRNATELLVSEISDCECMISTTPVSMEPIESIVPIEDHYIVTDLNSKIILLVNELNTKKHELETLQNTLNDHIEQADTVKETYKKMETSWQVGLLRIKEEHVEHVKQHALTHDAALATSNAENSTLKQHIDNNTTQICQLKDEKSQLEHELLQRTERHKQEVDNATTTISHYQKQCEIAQQRVLDIHQHTLTDTRERDARVREQQATEQREKCDRQRQFSATTHELNTQKTANITLKRKLAECDALDKEYRQVKIKCNDDALTIARYETELSTLKESFRLITDERETFRRTNLKMEGELAILRAEKQLNDARMSISAVHT